MKIKIDSGGYLHIERCGNFKLQMCMYSSSRACGDYCPQFREPITTIYDQLSEVNFGICKMSWMINSNDFSDERKPYDSKNKLKDFS